MARGARGGAASVDAKLIGGDKAELYVRKLGEKLASGEGVKAGFLEGVRYSATHPIRGTARKPLLVAQVAFWQEYGTKRAPARPFFRTTIAKKSALWGTILSRGLVYYKMDGAKALAALGTVMQSDIRESIVNWSTPPNAPRTVAIKGFNDPLIDDGTMQRVVNYQVMK
jgi:hypothetical protein